MHDSSPCPGFRLEEEQAARNPPASTRFMRSVMDLDHPAAPIPAQYDHECDWNLVREVFELMDTAFLEADVRDGCEEEYALRVSAEVGRLYAGFLLKQFRDAERLGAELDPPEFRFRGVRVQVSEAREPLVVQRRAG